MEAQYLVCYFPRKILHIEKSNKPNAAMRWHIILDTIYVRIHTNTGMYEPSFVTVAINSWQMFEQKGK